jgi:hypothetical protein
LKQKQALPRTSTSFVWIERVSEFPTRSNADRKSYWSTNDQPRDASANHTKKRILGPCRFTFRNVHRRSSVTVPPACGSSCQTALLAIAVTASGIEVISMVGSSVTLSHRVLNLPTTTLSNTAIVRAAKFLATNVAVAAGAVEDPFQLDLVKGHIF